jgi:D-alanyl-lipoteichoic acid acyltransferase DltB (MBOAT superfamily)
MLRLVAILLAVLALVGIIETASSGRQASLLVYRQSVSGGESLLREPMRAPVTLDAATDDSLSLELDPRGMRIWGGLRIEGRGRALIGVSSGGTMLLAAGAANCSAVGADGWICNVVWRLDRSSLERLPLYPAESVVTINSVTFTQASASRPAAVTASGLLMFLGLLLVLAPLIVLAGRASPSLELTILIGLSAAWIATTGVASALAITGFLAIGYFIIALELRQEEGGAQRLLLVAGFVILVLFYFKVLSPYASAAFGLGSLALPLGLSYFAVRLVDIIFAARARTLKQIGVVEFLGLMLHPSMLAAGPIITIGEFRRARISNWSVTDYGSGVARCLVGLAKKLIADIWLARAVQSLAGHVVLDPDHATARMVWPLLFCQLLYIYFDFTGYTDLALGTGRALGWRLPENFNLPLIRSNLQAYWQSWHMTLSNWVMRRVYFPAYMQSRSQLLAALCAMLTIGMWHQPNFGWAAWALHHALGLGLTIKVRERKIFAVPADRPIVRGAIYIAGWAFAMSWVALGMSYTLFDNFSLSLSTVRAAFRF